jgi:hypothetical protein
VNVFACHSNPATAASWLADQHVVKMTLETAQILSTVLVEEGYPGAGLYKPTHRNHPCVVAAKRVPGYFGWTALHGLALGEEYRIRFEKTHGALKVVQKAWDLSPRKNIHPESWALAMPDEFKVLDAQESYKLYLKAKYKEWRDKGGQYTPRWGRVVEGNPFVGELMKDAYALSKRIAPSGAIQFCFHVPEKYEGYSYIVASALKNGYLFETHLFPSDKDGLVLKYSALPGSQQNTTNIGQVLIDAGLRVVDFAPSTL